MIFKKIALAIRNIFILFILMIINLSKTYSTTLNINQEVHITSITYSWDNYSTNYTIYLSTNNDFSNFISSQTLSTNSTTYTTLSGNTTYYFRVKISTESDTQFSSTYTVTYTQTPTDLQIISNLLVIDFAQIGITFNPSNAYDTTYEIRYSSYDQTLDQYNQYNSLLYTGFPSFFLSGLLTNTTYYFKIKAYDRLNRSSIPTEFSSIISTQTIPKFPSSFSYNVFETSITFNWTPLNGPEDQDKSYAYEISITTTDVNPQTPTTYYYTLDTSTDIHTFDPLKRNTKYYFSFSVLNSIGVKNEKKGIFTTLTSPPANFKLISYSSSTATLGWNEFSSSPIEDSSLGYILEASSSSNFNEKIISSTTILSISTLTITDLKPNTTYYFRVASINISSSPNYSNIISTITLSRIINQDTINYYLTPRTIKIKFYPLNGTEDEFKSNGYRFTLSKTSAPYNIDYLSFSPLSSTDELQITSLRPNTTYYARLYTFNSNGEPNYDRTKKLITPLPNITQNAYVTLYTSDTITVEYSTVDADGYILEVSKNRFFSSIEKSSLTYSNDITKLSINALENNTEYFIRLGSIFGDTTMYISAEPSSITTLYPPPQNFQFSNIYITSVTLSWDQTTSLGYSLEASKSSSFETYTSSLTLSYLNNTLTISNLSPNTTYYFRVGTINSKNEKNYSIYLTTPTHANYPIEKPLSNLTTYSMQINWDSNLNPLDTLYIAEISSTNFYDSIISSQTYNTYAIFEGLNPNTTYYQRITAISRNNIPTGPIYFTPLATLAYKPINLKISASTHTLTLNWDDPNNAFGTLYLAEISSTNFYDSIISSKTLLKSSTFYNLNANTPYYIRVSALNFSDFRSEYETALSTTYVEIPKIKDPTFINVLLDGFTAQWDNNTNSIHTIYVVEASTKSDFSFIFKSTQTKQTQFVFPDLTPNTKYWVRIKAKGIIPSNESNYLLLGEISTLYREEKIINNQINEIVSIPYSYGSIELEIPSYSLGSVTKVFIEPELNPPPPTSNVGKLTPTGFAARIWIYPIVLYNGKLIVRIPYKNLPPSISKEKLVIARYDEKSGVWVVLQSKVYDTYVEAETYHLSIFQIMELSPSFDISNIKIYPNPYRPNSNLGKLSFSNMPSKTEIFIYTITGDLVKKIIANENGFAQWDGKNLNGRDVSSGVYIVLFKTPDGRKVTKKIGIEK